ncbi:hypothetical protein NDU88_008742 [Pleurodeles waltl]|uniref:Uncharacterized protein n=1 Tax=Pleurodeles waltl TaxID=8319 RepID=A0AAV7PT32_PLEWA|nr:hypothetical protein NDU88_008742 [Pleurodeles waltl]
MGWRLAGGVCGVALGWRCAWGTHQGEREPEAHAAQMPDARRGRESLAVSKLSFVDPAGKAVLPVYRSCRSSGVWGVSLQQQRCTPPAGGPQVSSLPRGFRPGPLLKWPVWVRLAGGKEESLYSGPSRVALTLRAVAGCSPCSSSRRCLTQKQMAFLLFGGTVRAAWCWACCSLTPAEWRPEQETHAAQMPYAKCQEWQGRQGDPSSMRVFPWGPCRKEA